MNPPMSPAEAFKLLLEETGMIKTTREGHFMIQRALDTMRALINERSAAAASANALNGQKQPEVVHSTPAQPATLTAKSKH